MNPKENGGHLPFEVQFSQREQFGTKEINVLDISPENPTGTVFLALGWNTTIDDYKDPIGQVYSAGNRIVTAELTGSEEQKAEQIENILNSKEIERTNLIAHSVGAISAVLAADRSFSIRRMVLLNPASMIGRDSIKDIISRYKTLMQEELSGREQGESMVTHRSFIEMAKTIVGFDMYGYLKKLDKRGVDIISVHGTHDTLFPAKRVLGEADRQNWEKMVFVLGKHMGISAHIPDAVKFLNRA